MKKVKEQSMEKDCSFSEYIETIMEKTLYQIFSLTGTDMRSCPSLRRIMPVTGRPQPQRLKHINICSYGENIFF
ncbi:hypothetical protein [Ruminococcus flavefaciens]|uniref:Uncharacterized protein n=1 Tax=Ruminococcus flavefaciens 007c TaxID=1341157 RepID=W7V1F7_RUMFL|nr:hypothetical protein [Ruminococcus flavefaciens]EWM54825.1 hypothetical protein RF007C_10835 [Ruminococcus flavefaciens 007c]